VVVFLLLDVVDVLAVRVVAGAQVGAVAHRFVCHRGDDCSEVPFLAAWAFDFNALVAGAVVTVVVIVLGFELVDLAFLLECGMVVHKRLNGDLLTEQGRTI
jgi:hypothetical protein